MEAKPIFIDVNNWFIDINNSAANILNVNTDDPWQTQLLSSKYIFILLCIEIWWRKQIIGMSV